MIFQVGGRELFDENRECFIYYPKYTLDLEHSLLAISKWEQYYEKPFLTDENNPHTRDEWLYYIKCMDTNNTVTDEVLKSISNKDLDAIIKYIDKPNTATTITNRDPNKNEPKKEIITSEVIYYMMTAQNIPFSCETWNLNRLLVLIRVCSIKNNPRKMSDNDLRKHYTQMKKRSRKPRK